jgi:hypothetical protein
LFAVGETGTFTYCMVEASTLNNASTNATHLNWE